MDSQPAELVGGPSPKGTKSGKRSIQRLLHLLNLKSRLGQQGPNFSHALGLTSERLFKENFAHNSTTKTLTYRYTVSSRLGLAPQDTNVALSTYMAIMDDVTTWSVLATKLKRPRPGVSVSLSAEWGPGATLGLEPGSVVDITATVTKTGQNLGFIQAEIRDAKTGSLVCFGSHTKYLSAGGWLLDNMALRNVGQAMVGFYAKFFLSDPTPSIGSPMSDLFLTLDFQTHTKARFIPSSKHANFFGDVHGGCQGMLMELVGRQVAMHSLATATVELESISLSYMDSASSVKNEELEINATVLNLKLPHSCTLLLVVKKSTTEGGNDGKVVSEGKLTFRADQTPLRQAPDSSSMPSQPLPTGARRALKGPARPPMAPTRNIPLPHGRVKSGALLVPPAIRNPKMLYSGLDNSRQLLGGVASRRSSDNSFQSLDDFYSYGGGDASQPSLSHGSVLGGANSIGDNWTRWSISGGRNYNTSSAPRSPDERFHRYPDDPLLKAPTSSAVIATSGTDHGVATGTASGSASVPVGGDAASVNSSFIRLAMDGSIESGSPSSGSKQNMSRMIDSSSVDMSSVTSYGLTAEGGVESVEVVEETVVKLPSLVGTEFLQHGTSGSGSGSASTSSFPTTSRNPPPRGKLPSPTAGRSFARRYSQHSAAVSLGQESSGTRSSGDSITRRD